MPRRPFLRRLAILVAALAAAGALAHLVLREVSIRPIHRLLEQNLSRTLGLEVTLEEAAIELLPSPHLHAEGARVANLPGREAADLLRIERLDLGIALWPLLGRTFEIDSLEIEGAELQIELDEQGRFALGSRLASLLDEDSGGALDVELRELDVEQLKISFRDGRSGAAHSVMLEDLELDRMLFGNELAIAVRGSFDGSPIALSGQIGSLRGLLDPEQPTPIQLEGRLFEAIIQAKGSLREPWKLAGLELEISAEIPELVVRGQGLSEVGPLQLDGHLSDLDGSLGLERLRFETPKHSAVQIEIHGVIDQLLPLEEVEITADNEADAKRGSLEFLGTLIEQWIDFAPPPIGSLTARTKLSHRPSGLALEGKVRLATADEAVVMRIEGELADLPHTPTLDLQLDLHAPDIASITTHVPAIGEHGAFGPLTAKARLHGQAGAISASDIAVRLGARDQAWAEIDGRIANIVPLEGAALELGFGATSLHHLRELLQHEFPQTPLLAGTAGIHDRDGKLALKHMQLHSSEEGPVEVHIDARFDDLPKEDTIAIELGIRGDDIRDLGALVGLDLPTLGPAELRGKVTGSEQRITAEGLAFHLGETSLEGNASGAFVAGTRPSMKAELSSQHVRLQDFGLRKAKEETRAPAPSWPTRDDLQGELPFDAMRHVDLELDLRFDLMTGYERFRAHDVGFSLELEDGHLVVRDAGANYEDGSVSAELRADARTPVPAIDLDFEIEHVDLHKLMAQLDETTDFAGIMAVDVDLQARGGSLDELSRSLGGHAAVSVRNGNITSKVGREFVVDLLEAARLRSARERGSAIGCSAARLRIEHGIATVETFALKNSEITLTASGEIDLVQGRYDLFVVPKPTNPRLLSITPEVLVSGPLDAPRFKTRKTTLVTSFGGALFKNALSAGGALFRPFRAQPENGSPVVDDCRDWGPEES